jgi:hypothetical protein
MAGLFFCKPWLASEYTIIESSIKEVEVLNELQRAVCQCERALLYCPVFPTERRKFLFTFIVFIIILGLCFFVYQYLTNQIISQRKRIMLLVNQNNELKLKLNKLMSTAASSKANNMDFVELSEEINENSQEI